MPRINYKPDDVDVLPVKWRGKDTIRVRYNRPRRGGYKPSTIQTVVKQYSRELKQTGVKGTLIVNLYDPENKVWRSSKAWTNIGKTPILPRFADENSVYYSVNRIPKFEVLYSITSN